MSAARYLAALFALLPGVFGGWPAASAQTLQEAVEQTLKTNPEVLIEVARQQSTREALEQAKSGYMPKIDLSTGGGQERKDNATVQSTYGNAINQKKIERSLTLTQMLFDGFATSSEVARNQARLDSADHKVAATSEQTALKAVENYLEVLRLRELLELTQGNLLIHQRTLDQIKVRVSGGMARKSDLDQIEARLALAGSNLTSAEANLDIAAINYKLVVGAPPKTLSAPKPPGDELIPSSPEEAVFFAIENSRFLRSAESDVDAAKAQHQAAKAGRYPRLDLEMGRTDTFTANSVDNQKDLTNYMMLRMRYNLFRGGADESRIGETRYQAKEAQEIRNRAERQLEQSVRLAWSAYRAARDRLPNLRKHAESALLTREAYTKQFSLGQRTLLDLLDTENEHFTAATNNINGYYVELFSRYRLLAEMSQLLATIGVSPSAARNSEMGWEPITPRNVPVPPLPGFSVIAPEKDEVAKPGAQEPAKVPAASATPAAASPSPMPPVEISPVPPSPSPADLSPEAEKPVTPDTPPVDTATEPAQPPSQLPKSTEAARLEPLNVAPELREPSVTPATPATPAMPVAPAPPSATEAAPVLSAPVRQPAPAQTDDFMEAPSELLYDAKQPPVTAPTPGEFMDATPDMLYETSKAPAIVPSTPAATVPEIKLAEAPITKTEAPPAVTTPMPQSPEPVPPETVAPANDPPVTTTVETAPAAALAAPEAATPEPAPAPVAPVSQESASQEVVAPESDPPAVATVEAPPATAPVAPEAATPEPAPAPAASAAAEPLPEAPATTKPAEPATDAPTEKVDRRSPVIAEPKEVAVVPDPQAEPNEKSQTDGFDWSEQQFWLVEIEGQFDRETLAATWKSLQARHATLLDGKSMLPRRRSSAEGGGYRLFIARFTSEKEAAELCTALATGGLKCRAAPSSALANPTQEKVSAPEADG